MRSPGASPRGPVFGIIALGLVGIRGMSGARDVHATVLEVSVAATVIPCGCSEKPYLGANDARAASTAANL